MVAEQLTEVRRRIAGAAQRSGRDAGAVELVAVSKGHGPDTIMEAYDAGHRVFGENRSDELVAKAAVLPDDITWHFVGQLQSRKTADVVGVADVIQSIDRLKLLRKLATTSDRSPSPRVYVQVNIAAEEQKGGAPPEQVESLLHAAQELGIPVVGLMLMPPRSDDRSQTRAWFAQLRMLRNDLMPRYPHLTGLSMGMTDDFELAIEEGATAIRVGRAIFGERHGGAAP